MTAAVFAGLYRVLVKGWILSYHKKEILVFTIDPEYGNLS